jgi:ribosomal protein L11 methyltransferase
MGYTKYSPFVFKVNCRMYYQVCFYTTDEALKEMIIALLSDDGYEGFEEVDDALMAYIAEADFDNEQLNEFSRSYSLSFEVKTIEKQNWNESWEKNFQPVIVEGFCTVRADFHDIEVTTPYEIVITPKMSFGTGHHATTFLVMQKMQELDFNGKKVLDFGTGTGILAILAELLGGARVNAVDNEEWAFLNSKENCERNQCNKISLSHGSLEDVEQIQYDIILANINRHILLQYMNRVAALLVTGGVLLLSGILKEDEGIITEAASAAGLKKYAVKEMKNWLVIEFRN